MKSTRLPRAEKHCACVKERERDERDESSFLSKISSLVIPGRTGMNTFALKKKVLLVLVISTLTSLTHLSTILNMAKPSSFLLVV